MIHCAAVRSAGLPLFQWLTTLDQPLARTPLLHQRRAEYGRCFQHAGRDRPVPSALGPGLSNFGSGFPSISQLIQSLRHSPKVAEIRVYGKTCPSRNNGWDPTRRNYLTSASNCALDGLEWLLKEKFPTNAYLRQLKITDKTLRRIATPVVLQYLLYCATLQ
jgi:hypothetical protein